MTSRDVITKERLGRLSDQLCRKAEEDLKARRRAEHGLTRRRAEDVLCGFREGVEAFAKALLSLDSPEDP